MRIGVLGGTRFIGYHLVEALLEIGAEICIFHRGQTVEPRSFSKPVKRIIGDRNNISSLKPFFEDRYDAVIDLSGYTEKQVFPMASSFRNSIGHYIFCSTSSAYQTPPPIPFDEEAPLVDKRGTYGGDKRASEQILLKAGHESNWPVTIFRP